jgi:hypothetical protein
MTREEFDEKLKGMDGPCCDSSMYDGINQYYDFKDEEMYDFIYYLLTDEDYKDEIQVLAPAIKFIYQALKA